MFQNKLGELQYKILYNDFGDEFVRVWYNKLYEICSIVDFEENIDEAIQYAKEKLDEKIQRIRMLLTAKQVIEGKYNE